MRLSVLLAPTPEQTARLGRHAGLSRVAWDHCLLMISTESLADALRRRPELADGVGPTTWSAKELYSSWRALQPYEHPWVEEQALCPQIPEEACRAVAQRLADNCAHGAPYPTRARRRPGRFSYSTGGYPVESRTVFLAGVGDVATVGEIADLEYAEVSGAKVRELHDGGWVVSFEMLRKSAPKASPQTEVAA